MGLGFDFNAMKQEAAKASEAEKTAILEYMHRYQVAAVKMRTMTGPVDEPDRIIEEASKDPLISAQAFVSFAVWAWEY